MSVLGASLLPGATGSSGYARPAAASNPTATSTDVDAYPKAASKAVDQARDALRERKDAFARERADRESTPSRTVRLGAGALTRSGMFRALTTSTTAEGSTATSSPPASTPAATGSTSSSTAGGSSKRASLTDAAGNTLDDATAAQVKKEAARLGDRLLTAMANTTGVVSIKAGTQLVSMNVADLLSPEYAAATAAPETPAPATHTSSAAGSASWETVRTALGLAEGVPSEGIMQLVKDVEFFGGTLDDLASGNFDGLREQMRSRAESLVASGANGTSDGLDIARRLASGFDGLRLFEEARRIDPETETALAERVDALAAEGGLSTLERGRLDQVAQSLDQLGLDLDFLSQNGESAAETLRQYAQAEFTRVGNQYLTSDTLARTAAQASVEAAYYDIAARMSLPAPTLLNRPADWGATTPADASSPALSPGSPSASSTTRTAASGRLDSLLSVVIDQNRAMGSTGFGGGFDFSGGGDLKSMLLQAMFGTPATGTASSSANAGAASSLFGSLSISSSWSSGLSSLSRAWNGFTSGAAQMFQSSFSLQGRLTSQGSQTVASLSASLSVSVSAAASATASGASGSGQVTIETILSVVRGEGFWDPVVLDLGGDGFNFRNAEDGADFDFDGDGTTERAGFIQGDDALLFLATDANGGRAQNGLDLFGDAAGHIHGFAALAEHDGNADGVIDENDAVYDQLRLWQDRNGDGVCDDDEVMTMAEAGVASLRLDYANTMERDEHGNLITQRSAFTRADGSAGAMVDAQFRAACAAAAYGMATP